MYSRYKTANGGDFTDPACFNGTLKERMLETQTRHTDNKLVKLIMQ